MERGCFGVAGLVPSRYIALCSLSSVFQCRVQHTDINHGGSAIDIYEQGFRLKARMLNPLAVNSDKVVFGI